MRVETSSLESQEVTSDQRCFEEELESTNPFDALKCLCVGMEGQKLKLFLYSTWRRIMMIRGGPRSVRL